MMRRIATLVAVAALTLTGCTPDTDTSASVPSAALETTAAPTPSPVDLTGLPVANNPTGDAVIPALPVDPDPAGDLTSERIRITSTVPVFASPDEGAVPVARIYPWDVDWARHDETAFPVLARDGDMVLVPVMARAGLVSEGVTGQAVGWVDTRSDGVEVYEDDQVVVLDVDAQTVTILDGADTVTSGPMAVGAPTTPTPVGRTAIVNTWLNARSTYTEGTPLIALARYSDTTDTLDNPIGGEAGQQVPSLIGLHNYWGQTTGQVSNGCPRVRPEMVGHLDALPAGTPVVIR